MRLICLVLAALSGGWLTVGVAQGLPNQELREQLCEQCPYDAPVSGIKRIDFSGPDAMTVVTADEMRNLGVVSVADMINQLSSQSEQESMSEAESVEGDAEEKPPEFDEAESGASDD
jgi:hypothetical protein